MNISIKQIETYDIIFGEKELTVGKMRGILQIIKEKFGDIPVCFFFNSDGDFSQYKIERYFNGVYQIDPTTKNSINLCPALNSSEALLTIGDLENAFLRIPIGATIRQDEYDTVQISDTTLVRVGANMAGDPTGKITELFIVNGECFIFTSTYGIDWESVTGATSFGQRIFQWFMQEYCPGLGYESIYRMIF